MLISVSLTGSGLIGFVCLNQLDLKVIIAYSSVAHMGLSIGGLLYLNNYGLSGSLILLIAHGLRSSVIFYGGNTIYIRRFSRRIIIAKGLLTVFPLISFFFLISPTFKKNSGPLIKFNSGTIMYYLNYIIWPIQCSMDRILCISGSWLLNNYILVFPTIFIHSINRMSEIW